MNAAKKQYSLDGLCCENCARKIEKEISLIDGIKTAQIDTETAVLSIEFNKNTQSLVEYIKRIALSQDAAITVRIV